MDISFSNLKKPSDKSVKRVADFFLYTLPLYLGAVMALPLTEEVKLWVNFGVTLLIVTMKGFSKLTSEETPQQ